MTPYISESERKAASRMTWSTVVTHVRETDRCSEQEARRQIGNAIADSKLFPRWTDKPIGSPIPGTKISRAPITSTLIFPYDTPPRDADYWLECEIDPTDPDRVLEPPPYDSSMADKRTAKRLDKTRRYRKPTFDRFHVFRLWPIAKAASTEAEKTDASHASRNDTNIQYNHWLSDFREVHKRYPTREDDEKWGSEHHISRTRVRELRREFLPDEVKKGGAPKKGKPGEK